jgi:hypothetical protein
MASAQSIAVTRRANLGWLALAACGVLAAVWLLRTFDPNAAGSLFPPCPFRTITGLFCPGCGITRALHALVHFDFARALAMNAMVVLSLPLLALMALQGFSRRAVLPKAVARVVFDGRGWIAAMALFGVLRNVPGFEWLAPGGML